MNLLITGTGRCRTAWASRVLSQHGNLCTHQAIRHDHVVGASPWPVNTTVDSSFEAAPLAVQLAHQGWRIILLVRDPVEVVASWLSLGAFHTSMPRSHSWWWRSIERHAPEIAHARSPVERATWFYVRWNQMVLFADPITLPVEYTTAQHLWDYAYPDEAYLVAEDPGPIDVGTPERVSVALNDDEKMWIWGEMSMMLPEFWDRYRP